jgi:hypothetical protein
MIAPPGGEIGVKLRPPQSGASKELHKLEVMLNYPHFVIKIVC